MLSATNGTPTEPAHTPAAGVTPPPAGAAHVTPSPAPAPVSAPQGAESPTAGSASRPASAPPPASPVTSAPAEPHLTGSAAAFAAVRREIAKAVVGQEDAVSAVLIGLITGGHVLLEGVPGTAKTLLVRSLAAALATDFKRVQFTPDLMPGDLTGSLIYTAATGQFTFRPGPVFTNILLADEINRTPPKTQAALLEAMAEHQVSVDGQAKELPEPFMVVATQNPIEYEGTYSLPEAQLDRFLMKVTVPLPGHDVELEMLRRHAASFDPADLRTADIRPVASAEDVLQARREVQNVAVHPAILEYIVQLVRATRENPAVQVAVSPRGATALLAVARGWAWLSGRNFTTPDDVKVLAIPALAHRMQLQPEAELDGLTTAQVLSTILASVPAPR